MTAEELCGKTGDAGDMALPESRVGHRGRVRWELIDRALRAFTRESVLALVGAGLDSPLCRAWEYHLTLLWARALRRDPAGTIAAQPADLIDLVAAAMRAAPSRPVASTRWPNDPRRVVGFSVLGRRWRVHPGDYEHPLMLLRQIAATAKVIDQDLMAVAGFTLTDVITVVLAHGDRTVAALAPAWPEGAADAYVDAAELVVTEAEVAVAAGLLHRDAADVAAVFEEPRRAAAALAWLTCDSRTLTLRRGLFASVLGPVLLVDHEGGRAGVPACLTLGVLAAATEALIRLLDGKPGLAGDMQALTVDHAATLLSKQIVSRAHLSGIAGALPPVVVGNRYTFTVVSALQSGRLSRALEWGKAYLHSLDWLQPAAPLTRQEAAQRVKVVLYGGLAVLGLQVVTDTIMIHIEELVEMLADARGDWTTVSCFLEDLGKHSGYEQVVFLDVLDVWAAWRDHGVLGPLDTGEHGGVLQVVPHPCDQSWGRCVAWEPIDAVMTAADCPGHVDWPITRLVDSGCADLFTTASGETAMVATDPPLLIWIDLADAASLGLNPDTLFGMMDGLRLTVSRHAAVGDHFRLADGVPLVLILRLTGERTPEDADGHRVGIATDPERGRVSISVGPDILEQFAGDGATGHELLGLVVHEAVKTLRERRAEAAGTPAGQFLAAWRDAGPLFTLMIAYDTGPDRTPVDTLPRTPAITARVLRAVAEGLRRRRAHAGQFVDDDAHRVCQSDIIPAIEDLLRERIGECDQTLLWGVASRLNAAQATRHRRSRELDHALAGRWADNWHEYAMDGDEHARASRVLELLFEFIFAYPPTGSAKLDEVVVAELAALTELLLVVASQDDGFARDLHGLAVSVRDDGWFTVDVAPQRQPVGGPSDVLDIDVEAYQNAQRIARIAEARGDRHAMIAAQDASLPADDDAVVLRIGDNTRQLVEFESFREFAPPLLITVDDQLKSLRGTGFDAVAAVLGTAATLPTESHGLATVAPDELVAQAAQWSGLPLAEIDAAFRSLLLTGDDLRVAEDRSYLEVEHRSHRLALRPLPVVDGQVWILPWQITAAQDLHSGYLAHARLPYRARDVTPSVVNAMTSHRQILNNELEEQVHEVVGQLGLAHRMNFDQHQAAVAGIAHLHGEIDLLIADPAKGRLWVCEIKDLLSPFSPATMRQHVRKFTWHNGFVAKLLAKAEQIGENTEVAARACGQTGGGPWRVIPLMITRRVESAAFAGSPQIAFTTVCGLAAVLTNRTDPPPGHSPGHVVLGGNSADSTE